MYFGGFGDRGLREGGAVMIAEHLPTRLAYQSLSAHLPALRPPCPQRSPHGGRPVIDRNALVRALVYRALRRLTSLSDLAQALRENPALQEAIGLDPLGAIPSVEDLGEKPEARFQKLPSVQPNLPSGSQPKHEAE